ncbi:MAG: tryptophan-rich sensory protein [Candidatus Roizmanbacteria bacterium]|nr:tryptophan-rich sensory protein [Candidatus Roizmanbacteria bacterium]
MKNTLIKILAGVSYVAMVVVNGMANALPINNRSTGQISDAYPNLFAPAGVTFSIWGLIYLLLAGYVTYQFIKKDKKTEGLFSKINPLFIATSFFNILWIFAWHYDFIGLSVVLMGGLLFLLIKIADILYTHRFSSQEKLFIWAPFSVYFGWITVAAIANITVFFVSIGWNRFGIADFIWTSIILAVGAFIGILRMNKDKNIAYGLVLVWAYLGILLKHVSATGFSRQYPSIIATVVICLVLFLFFVGRTFYKK